MKLVATILITFVLLQLTAPAAFGRQKGSWDDLKNFVNREIVVEAKNKSTSFGILRHADENEIRVQIAGIKNLTSQEVTFRKDEVSKIRQAELRFGGRNVGKGALIGAGAGAGVGLLTAIVGGKSGGEQSGAAVPVYTIYGAGIGAVIGLFSKKTHKKGALIYSV